MAGVDTAAPRKIWTARDIAALSPRQRDALGWVCIGIDGGQPVATLAALARKGLLTAVVVEARDRLGTFRYTRYEVASIGVHAAWCAWCDEQPDDEPAQKG